MPMHRWIARAAGGTSQRLNPGPAMIRDRSRIPARGAEALRAVSMAGICVFSLRPRSLRDLRLAPLVPEAGQAAGRASLGTPAALSDSSRTVHIRARSRPSRLQTFANALRALLQPALKEVGAAPIGRNGSV